jgi:hypothetical protein
MGLAKPLVQKGVPSMGNRFFEVVFEGHFNTVRGYVEGLQDGMGMDCKFFFSSEAGIEAETLSELIREWVSLGHKLHHVVMEEALFDKIKDVLSKKSRHALMTCSSIKSSKIVRGAAFDFEFEAYARKYADEIKALLSRLPQGVSLRDYKPEEKINHKAEGVELYTPAHDYIFRGKGRIAGPVEQVIVFRRVFDEHPLVDVKKVFLDLAVHQN